MNEILNDRYQDSRDMSLSARDQYEREVSWLATKQLSPEEEKKYLDRIRRFRLDPSNKWLQSLAKDARERLAEHYQPLIRRVVASYARSFPCMDFLDLVQEANLALLRAIETYDFDFERPFQAWMFGCVRMTLDRLYQKGKGFGNSSVYKGISDIANVEQRYFQLGRSPSSSDLACELGLPLSRIFELLHYRALQEFSSIEAMSERYEMPEDCHDFAALYPQFSEEEIARSDATTACVDFALSQFSGRRREVLQLRYGLCGDAPHTGKEIGALLRMKDRNVESTVYQAKKRLQALLTPLYERQEVSA